VITGTFASRKITALLAAAGRRENLAGLGIDSARYLLLCSDNVAALDGTRQVCPPNRDVAEIHWNTCAHQGVWLIADGAAQRYRNSNALRIKIFVVVFSLWSELDLLVSGFWVLEDFAFVIPDDDFLVVVIQDVAGIDRHLAAAARRIDNELGHGVTGGVTAQAFDDLNAPGDRSAQMR
jgi:hypothetical protein